jgi:hypothetical protein
MQYRLLSKVLQLNGSLANAQAVTVPADVFRSLLVNALRAKGEFDAEFYLLTHSDVREAVRQRRVESAEDHYYTAGYFEGRVPKRFSVDEKFYLAANPDVADAIRKGKVRSAQEHFENSGFGEGRAPFKNFSLY